jgi:hypothetical protein
LEDNIPEELGAASVSAGSASDRLVPCIQITYRTFIVATSVIPLATWVIWIYRLISHNPIPTSYWYRNKPENLEQNL